jgi:hypothetical protein
MIRAGCSDLFAEVLLMSSQLFAKKPLKVLLEEIAGSLATGTEPVLEGLPEERCK